MNRTELENILPHRPPMLLLDESEVVDGEAHGRLAIHGDEFFLQGHFPNNPIVPGVMQCEMLAQNCCVLIAGKMEGSGKTPLYTGLQEFHPPGGHHRPHLPPDTRARSLLLRGGRGICQRSPLL